MNDGAANSFLARLGKLVDRWVDEAIVGILVASLLVSISPFSPIIFILELTLLAIGAVPIIHAYRHGDRSALGTRNIARLLTLGIAAFCIAAAWPFLVLSGPVYVVSSPNTRMETDLASEIRSPEAGHELIGHVLLLREPVRRLAWMLLRPLRSDLRRLETRRVGSDHGIVLPMTGATVTYLRDGTACYDVSVVQPSVGIECIDKGTASHRYSFSPEIGLASHWGAITFRSRPTADELPWHAVFAGPEVNLPNVTYAALLDMALYECAYGSVSRGISDLVAAEDLCPTEGEKARCLLLEADASYWLLVGNIGELQQLAGLRATFDVLKSALAQNTFGGGPATRSLRRWVLENIVARYSRHTRSFPKHLGELSQLLEQTHELSPNHSAGGKSFQEAMKKFKGGPMHDAREFATAWNQALDILDGGPGDEFQKAPDDMRNQFRTADSTTLSGLVDQVVVAKDQTWREARLKVAMDETDCMKLAIGFMANLMTPGSVPAEQFVEGIKKMDALGRLIDTIPQSHRKPYRAWVEWIRDLCEAAPRLDGQRDATDRMATYMKVLSDSRELTAAFPKSLEVFRTMFTLRTQGESSGTTEKKIIESLGGAPITSPPVDHRWYSLDYLDWFMSSSARVVLVNGMMSEDGVPRRSSLKVDASFGKSWTTAIDYHHLIYDHGGHEGIFAPGLGILCVLQLMTEDSGEMGEQARSSLRSLTDVEFEQWIRERE